MSSLSLLVLGLLLSPAPASPEGNPASAETTRPTEAQTIERSELPELEPDEAVEEIEFETYRDDPIAVKQVVLENGLTVMLSENHERPEVFGAVVVRTGGKNDPADNTGMAHYLEHMLFKGTTSLGTSDWKAEEPLQQAVIDLYEAHKAATSDAERGAIQRQIAAAVEKTYAYVIPNELDRILSEMGGTGVNAFTSEDETVYYNTFPASQMSKWLDVYAHRFEEPVFRLFPTELEAVYEEKNITLDRFEVKLLETFSLRAFPEHPYGTQTVIGEVEHLKRPSLVAMRAYFDKYYVANNMALVIVGDFEADQIMLQIAERFGAWRSGPEPEVRTGKVDAFSGRELVKLRVTPLRVGAFGFRTLAPKHPDYAALLVVRELLFNEQGSGFIDRLVDEGKLLIALPFALDFADHGLDVVFFAPRIFSQSFKNAERHLRAQFERVAHGEFDDKKMAAIRDGLRRGEDRQWEDNEERALAMGSSFIRQESWQGYLSYRERLSKVTREDVMRVATSYFSEDHLAMRSRMGFPKKKHLEAPDYPNVKPTPGVSSEAYRRMSERPSPDAHFHYVDFEKDVETAQVGPGVVVRTNPNPFNDTYSMEFRFGVGTDAIRELSVAGEYLGRLGTAKHSPAAFREELFLIGTTLEIETTIEETIVHLSGPEANLAAALALLDGILREPLADKKRWRSLRRERRGYEKVARRDPEKIADAIRQFVMYGDNSSHLNDYGKAGLRKLSPKDLLTAWKRAQGYELEIRYAGQQDSKRVAETIASTMTFQEGLKPAVPHIVYPRVLPKYNTVYFLPRRNAIQSRLWFVVEGQPVARDQIAASSAYSGYLGGSMAGLIFQEIREFRALAYSAWGRFYRDTNPAQSGFFLGSIGCQGDKTQEAIEVMMGLITDMPKKREQMDALRSSLIRREETRTPGFRELQGAIKQWQELAYKGDPRKWMLADFAKLSFDDVEAFYEAQVQGRPVTLIVVGDPRRFDVDALATYGELIKVKERQIYPR